MLKNAVVIASEFLILIAILILYGRKEAEDKEAANGLFLFIFLLVIAINIGLHIYNLVKEIRSGSSQVKKVSNGGGTSTTRANLKNDSSRTAPKNNATVEEGGDVEEWNVKPDKKDSKTEISKQKTPKKGML